MALTDALDAGSAKELAERAEEHHLVERVARAGLLSRAVVWLLIGALAASVAFGGGSSQSSDQGGALRAVAGTPGGRLLLVLLAAGFVAYSLYRFLCAAVGHRDDEGRTRLLHRLKSAAEGLVYGAAAASTLRTALGQAPDSERETRSFTAAVMGVPGGRTLVGLLGAGAVLLAVALFVRACTHHHVERLEGVPSGLRRPFAWLGVAGLAGRSLAIGLVGGFLVVAALRFDAQQA